MRNSSLNNSVQNYMLHTMYFLRHAWMGLISLFKLEVLLFHSTNLFLFLIMIMYLSSLPWLLSSIINTPVFQSARALDG